ncbi:MAG: type IV pilus biogenesis/stability protein PilW [Burkholderiales bacterium]
MRLDRLVSRAWQAGKWAGLASMVAALVACVAAGPAVSPATAPDAPVADPSARQAVSGGRSDLVTASDESDVEKRSRVRLELAGAYFSQGQATTALDEVKRALVINPSSVGAYNLRGLIYASMDEHPLADESFRRALQLAPNDADSRHNYGWYLCRLRRYAEAQVHFEAAMAVPQYRGQSKTLLAQGICQARSGDLAGAEKTLLRSYEIDAGNPATAINLAEVLMRRGALERARFYVARVNAVPDLVDAETLWLAVRIEQRRGNKEGVDEFGGQLRQRFPGSRQSAAMQRGQFDE